MYIPPPPPPRSVDGVLKSKLDNLLLESQVGCKNTAYFLIQERTMHAYCLFCVYIDFFNIPIIFFRPATSVESV